MDDNKLVFGLGDASGKSLAAALNALMLRYLIRGLVQALGSDEIKSIVSYANHVIAEDLRDGDQFITLVLGSINPLSGLLKIVNAGHEPVLVLRAGSAKVEATSSHNLVLGINPNVQFVLEEIMLAVGDRVVVYTDGLTEATNARGELFTIDRLKESMLSHRDLGAQAFADSLFEAVKTYAGHDMRDDATVLVIIRTGLDSAADNTSEWGRSVARIER
jgi:sigma-B regulation protein RsbU (phosphoserine phosphatase)